MEGLVRENTEPKQSCEDPLDKCKSACDSTFGENAVIYNPARPVAPKNTTPVTTTPMMLVLGTFIALMLACIAGLLGFAICVRPLMNMVPAKHAYDSVNAVM